MTAGNGGFLAMWYVSSTMNLLGACSCANGVTVLDSWAATQILDQPFRSVLTQVVSKIALTKQPRFNTLIRERPFRSCLPLSFLQGTSDVMRIPTNWITTLFFGNEFPLFEPKRPIGYRASNALSRNFQWTAQPVHQALYDIVSDPKESSAINNARIAIVRRELSTTSFNRLLGVASRTGYLCDNSYGNNEQQGCHEEQHS